MKQWSTLRKLLLLRLIMGGGVPIETMTATGTSPLSLANAIAHSILSLTQTGKCLQASTPTPTSPVDIKCNNGVVKWDSVNERVYADGTPEVITVTHADSTTETASAVDLFSIPDSDYADTQEIIGGTVTHKIGIKVFDGTEGWSRTSARAQVTLEDSVGGSSLWTPICSHYKSYGASTTLANMDDNSMKYNGSGTTTLWKDSTHNTSLDDWKAWVKSQYDAGTPIILVYPLAEPTTETVTGQPLSTTAGTNSVSWTAEVSGKTMSAEFKGSTADSNKVGTGKVGYMKI